MDFRVFPKVKSQLRGIRFASKQELTVAAKRIVLSFDADWYRDTFDKWISRHIKCIRVGVMVTLIMLLTEAVRETAIHVTISCKPKVMATKITRKYEARVMAIHVTEEAVFRRKPAVTATEIMHQVMA
ncbi:hypothetical protein DPMN_110287 [Dreissena polymorpha]|uniref:Uncharacterized protein n=1 Tax=Dreissena polymorpha TaxID=45954 RepID=A0A9D4QMS7_DREPO|nr:hypothetical protein DPMN_110287 [Dreissena polymorpha]